MTTCQARKIRKGIRLADMCWDLTKYGGTENVYFLDTVDGTRRPLWKLSRKAFDIRLGSLRAHGREVQR